MAAVYPLQSTKEEPCVISSRCRCSWQRSLRPERRPPAALRPSVSARCRPACGGRAVGPRDHDPPARSDAPRRAHAGGHHPRRRDGVSRDFTATATGEPGVYVAHVVFPESGSWNIAVDTGWWGEGGLTIGPGDDRGRLRAASRRQTPSRSCPSRWRRARRAAGGGDARREEALEADGAPAVGRRPRRALEHVRARAV